MHFPVGGSTEVGDIDFVRFISTGATPDSLEGEVDLSGVALDMDVEVTPDAHFELIFDPTVGDILSGSGRGNIQMRVTPSGDFTMRGAVEVTGGRLPLHPAQRGEQALPDRSRVAASPGMAIPSMRTLDLDAVYKLRAPLYDIMRDKDEAYKQARAGGGGDAPEGEADEPGDRFRGARYPRWMKACAPR